MSNSLRDAIHTLGVDAASPQGLRAVFEYAGLSSCRQLIDEANVASSNPGRLQFRLRFFVEEQSTDSVFQGASDEVYISGIGTDSAAVVIGPDNLPDFAHITGSPVGDASDNTVRDGWRANPHVLLEFDLHGSASWPRTFTTTLLIVEEDNGNLEEAFTKLEAEVGKEIKAAVITAAATTSGVLVGAALGSVIPGVGTVVGAAVGAIAGLAYDTVISEIKSGLGNEAFTPVSLAVAVPDPAAVRNHPDIGTPRTIQIAQFGAKYDIEYDWNLAE